MNKMLELINERIDFVSGILWALFGICTITFGDNLILGTVHLGIGIMFLCTDKIITHLKRKG